MYEVTDKDKGVLLRDNNIMVEGGIGLFWLDGGISCSEVEILLSLMEGVKMLSLLEKGEGYHGW